MTTAADGRDQGDADQGGGGGVGPGSMLAKPAAQPLEPPLGVSRHRLVGQPVLEVLRQRRAPSGNASSGSTGHRLQADRFERRRASVRSSVRGGSEVALQDLFDHFGDLLAAEREPAPVNSS